jgi:hypothetical protein
MFANGMPMQDRVNSILIPAKSLVFLVGDCSSAGSVDQTIKNDLEHPICINPSVDVLGRVIVRKLQRTNKQMYYFSDKKCAGLMHESNLHRDVNFCDTQFGSEGRLDPILPKATTYIDDLTYEPISDTAIESLLEIHSSESPIDKAEDEDEDVQCSTISATVALNAAEVMSNLELQTGYPTQLTSLLASNGIMTPLFSSGILVYSIVVDGKISSIQFKATAAASSATILVQGVKALSGVNTAAIPLTMGNQTIAIVVKESGDATEYRIQIMRASMCPIQGKMFQLAGKQMCCFGKCDPGSEARTADLICALDETVTVYPLCPSLQKPVISMAERVHSVLVPPQSTLLMRIQKRCGSSLGSSISGTGLV